MADTPEELKLDIERTREALARDLDRIVERVHPGHVTKRKIENARWRIRGYLNLAVDRMRKNPRQTGLAIAGTAALVTLAVGLPIALRHTSPATVLEPLGDRRSLLDRRSGHDRRAA